LDGENRASSEEAVAAAKDVISEFKKAQVRAEEERFEVNRMVSELSREDREFVKGQLLEAAGRIREKYAYRIPQIRRLLHALLEQSV
jgi:hypothetical protein